MADATKPGAPTKNVSELPPATEKSVSREVQRKAPSIASLLATPDRVMLRLNKLLASPGGLSAFLSTFNYTLYILAFADGKSLPLRQKLAALLNRPVPTSGAPNFLALASVISQTRTTLRLFGLFPLYAWFRQLMRGPKPGQDTVLYATAVTQCLLYLFYQFMENVGVLIDGKILSATTSARWTASAGGKTDKVYLWAYRAWLGGIVCDFVRLAREAQLESIKRARRSVHDRQLSVEQDEKVDAQWWRQAVVPAAWLPVALHSSVEGGVSWAGLGVLGFSGWLAGLGRTADLWAATAEA